MAENSEDTATDEEDGVEWETVGRPVVQWNLEQSRWLRGFMLGKDPKAGIQPRRWEEPLMGPTAQTR